VLWVFIALLVVVVAVVTADDGVTQLTRFESMDGPLVVVVVVGIVLPLGAIPILLLVLLPLARGAVVVLVAVVIVAGIAV
jgi:hypothetical protein